MIIYLHEDIQGCPFMSTHDSKDIDCWNWYDCSWIIPLTRTHICMGVKNQCSQVV